MYSSAYANSAMSLIDMNLNRASEGLRTVEDIARLVRRDASVAAAMKSLRHELQLAVQELPRSSRLASRSTHRDAGTQSTESSEQSRLGFQQIVSSASERTTQSLRVLEETLKLIDHTIAEKVKQLRYVAYDRLAHAELRLLHEAFPHKARLYLLLDCSEPLDSFAARIEAYAEAGVDVFQLRDKQADGARLLQYARCGVGAATKASKLFIVNDRVDIAIASGASGVHLGQEDLAIEDARAMLDAKMFVGVSTHDIKQVDAAVEAGADYIGCGPTFPSTTKPFDSFPGLPFLTEAAGRGGIPIFAIGGIGASNIGDVLATGCQGVAVSSSIHAADNPFELACWLAEMLNLGE
jgi:thiamine-phosphate pyrophosphorylase